jgi:hypothetical protein
MLCDWVCIYSPSDCMGCTRVRRSRADALRRQCPDTEARLGVDSLARRADAIDRNWIFATDAML